MTDKLTNWYEVLAKDKTVKLQTFTPDKNFNKHYILPASMILCVGGTGSGKSTALLEFIKRKSGVFTQIIIFSGSGTDEPLYNYLVSKNKHVELYNNIAELPELIEFDRDSEKLIVFDDFINLPAKDFKKINEYLTAGRKYGFTVWLMSQNYVSVPKTIIRNLNYLIIFKLNDNISINTIIKNHSLDGIAPEKFKEYYSMATRERGNFLMIDMKTVERRLKLRRNFLDLYII